MTIHLGSRAFAYRMTSNAVIRLGSDPAPFPFAHVWLVHSGEAIRRSIGPATADGATGFGQLLRDAGGGPGGGARLPGRGGVAGRIAGRSGQPRVVDAPVPRKPRRDAPHHRDQRSLLRHYWRGAGGVPGTEPAQRGGCFPAVFDVFTGVPDAGPRNPAACPALGT